MHGHKKVYYGAKSSVTEICQAETLLFAFFARLDASCCPPVNHRQTLSLCSIPQSARFIQLPCQ